MSDEELMSLYAQSAQSEAFSELYERYHPRLVRYLNRRLFQKGRLDDLCQIVWLKIHRARSRFNSEMSFPSWFFTIALNVLRDYTREKPSPLELHEAEVAASQESESSWDFQRQMAEIETHLQILPPLARDLILLVGFEGFSSAEAATILEISPESARQILSRQRRKLKEALND
jgi:RNA polymerase sigma-70 factor (ECF subfamily)